MKARACIRSASLRVTKKNEDTEVKMANIYIFLVKFVYICIKWNESLL